jgi:hypothetical protein
LAQSWIFNLRQIVVPASSSAYRSPSLHFSQMYSSTALRVSIGVSLRK